MTQTQSLKDKLKQAFSFFLWELKSCSGTLAIYGILTAVFTVVILTMCMAIGGITDANSADFSETIFMNFNISDVNNAIEAAKIVFQQLALSMISLMTVIFTVVYTIKVFGYLHNKRQEDMYGSMPVGRITLFLSKSCSALVFSVVPAFVFIAIVAGISLAMGRVCVDDIIGVSVNLLIGSLACISAYGLIAVCCGTTVNSVIVFVAVCIAYPVAAVLVKSIVGGFFYGFYTAGINDSFVMYLLCPVAAYGGSNIVYWLIFTAVCTLGAIYLVKNRKAERAQASFAYYLPCHIIKTLVSFVAGVFLGMIFGMLNVFGNGILGFAFGFIIASVTAYFVSHLVLYRGFSKLLKTAIPLVVVIVVTIGMIVLCDLDVFGYNSYVPNIDNVKSAGLISSEYCYIGKNSSTEEIIKNSVDDFTDKKVIEDIIDAHSKNIIISDFNSAEKFENSWIEMIRASLGYYNYVNISYKLDNGNTINRFYSDVSSDWSLSYDDDYDSSYILVQSAVSKVVATKEYQLKYSGVMNADESEVTDIYVCGNDKSGEYGSAMVYENVSEKNTEKVKKLLEAYRKDFINDDTYIDEVLDYITAPYYETYSENTVCDINFTMKSNGLFNNYIFESFVVPKSYTNTIKVLQDIGCVDENLNVIIDELYYE